MDRLFPSDPIYMLTESYTLTSLVGSSVLLSPKSSLPRFPWILRFLQRSNSQYITVRNHYYETLIDSVISS